MPTGKIGVSPGGELDGRAIATRVAIGKHAQVIRGGVCGDGTLSVGEQCDVSAANGDAACPGKCVAGDPQGLGNIANGGPGQCRCSCTTDAECSDGNKCNGAEKCQNNICVPGDPPNCDDNNPCTTDCDPSIGCLSPGEPRPDGSGCSDNNLCTAGDECQNGQCVSGQARDCDDKNSCTTDSCDPTLGCQHVALPTGASCEDGSLCTTGDSCIRGVCVGGPPPNCDDSNPCTASTCVPRQGLRGRQRRERHPLPNAVESVLGKGRLRAGCLHLGSRDPLQRQQPVHGGRLQRGGNADAAERRVHARHAAELHVLRAQRRRLLQRGLPVALTVRYTPGHHGRAS